MKRSTSKPSNQQMRSNTPKKKLQDYLPPLWQSQAQKATLAKVPSKAYLNSIADQSLKQSEKRGFPQEEEDYKIEVLLRGVYLAVRHQTYMKVSFSYATIHVSHSEISLQEGGLVVLLTLRKKISFAKANFIQITFSNNEEEPFSFNLKHDITVRRVSKYHFNNMSIPSLGEEILADVKPLPTNFETKLRDPSIKEIQAYELKNQMLRVRNLFKNLLNQSWRKTLDSSISVISTWIQQKRSQFQVFQASMENLKQRIHDLESGDRTNAVQEQLKTLNEELDGFNIKKKSIEHDIEYLNNQLKKRTTEWKALIEKGQKSQIQRLADTHFLEKILLQQIQESELIQHQS